MDPTKASSLRLGAAGDGHGVVKGDAGSDVGPLHEPFGQRVQEGNGPGQVRGEDGKDQPALVQGLLDEGEVEHLQVAQSAVDELRGPRRGAGRPVVGLDDADAQAAGHGIKGGPGADDAAAYDQDVEFLAGLGAGPEHREGRFAFRGSKRTAGQGSTTGKTVHLTPPSGSNLVVHHTTSKFSGWAGLYRPRRGAQFPA